MATRKTATDSSTPRRARAKKATADAAASAPRRVPKTRAARKPEPASTPPPTSLGLDAAIDALRQTADRLTTSWNDVARSIEELPRVTDLQPLADHLYEFAQTAPILLESLRELPAALEPVETATRTLTEISERLESAQARLNDALFHMPRPSEYEPLAEPLREFARVAPALAEGLGGLPRVTTALDGLQRRIETTADRLEARADAQETTLAAPLATAASAGVTAGLLTLRLDRIGEAIERARDEIRLALGSLPTAADYGPVARQLKEIASVSPTLLEWLEQEVPKLTAPLSESVTALRAAAQALDSAFVDVEITRRDLIPEGGGAARVGPACDRPERPRPR